MRNDTDNTVVMRKKSNREVAGKNMLFGAIWCIGGTLVTALTYQAASAGGHYIIAWGAIVFGAFQFLRGLVQLAGNL